MKMKPTHTRKIQLNKLIHIIIIAVMSFTIGHYFNMGYITGSNPDYQELQPSGYFLNFTDINETHRQYLTLWVERLTKINGVIQTDEVVLSNIRGYELEFTSMTYTGSMRPLLSDESLGILARVPIDEIKVGDIIVVERDDGTYLGHRLIKITEDGLYKTKGDNNPLADSDLWRADQIYGKIVAVIY